MKAVVIDKKHLTLVSHTNGVVIVEESGCIINLDFQSLASICEIANLGNTYPVSELHNQVQNLTDELNRRGEQINQLNKIIEEKTNSFIKLANAEELVERTHALKVFKQALYAMRLYVQPHKEYKLDTDNSTVLNSISSSFFIRFKDISIASRAINDCRYCISLKEVLDKYKDDIVDFNVSAMNIYYIREAYPNVVRKFNYDNFNITCKDQLTTNTINTLLNCSNSSVDDIVETFKNKIAYSNIH